eukprot:GILJ01025698.1.p1 GENE.GILJ01025698.1~~GILJ01025698.1.p1  ORF type:complete len:513 (+),score=19.26 GILJ01025698.1:477-2015(+)
MNLPQCLVGIVQQFAWGLTWRQWKWFDVVTRIHIAIGLNEHGHIPALLGPYYSIRDAQVRPEPNVKMSMLIACGWTFLLAEPTDEEGWLNLILGQCDVETIQHLLSGRQDLLRKIVSSHYYHIAAHRADKEILTFVFGAWDVWPPFVIGAVIESGSVPMLRWLLKEKPGTELPSMPRGTKRGISDLAMTRYLYYRKIFTIWNLGTTLELGCCQFETFVWMFETCRKWESKTDVCLITHRLLKTGSLEHVQFLYDRNINYGGLQQWGDVELSLAIEGGNVELAQWVYDHQPQSHKQNKFELTILVWLRCTKPMMRWILSTFRERLVLPQAGVGPLVRVTQDVPLVQWFLDLYGLDPKTILPLYVCLEDAITSECDTKMLHYLFDNGVTLSTSFNPGDLCSRGSVQVVEFFLMKKFVSFPTIMNSKYLPTLTMIRLLHHAKDEIHILCLLLYYLLQIEAGCISKRQGLAPLLFNPWRLYFTTPKMIQLIGSHPTMLKTCHKFITHFQKHFPLLS